MNRLLTTISVMALCLSLDSCFTRRAMQAHLSPGSREFPADTALTFRYSDSLHYQSIYTILQAHADHKLVIPWLEKQPHAITLRYDGMKHLNVSSSDSTYGVRVKVRREGNTLFLRRKFFLIPVPILLTVYSNRLSAVQLLSDGSLEVGSGSKLFIMVGLPVGQTYKFNTVLRRM